MLKVRPLLFLLAFGVCLALTASADNIEPSVGLNEDQSVESGGTYCNGAVLIQNLPYHDCGNLDGDNDCSAPTLWPYNDVFYKFIPAVAGDYIMRLHVRSPSTTAALRIVKNGCCSGCQEVAADTDLVATDCDSLSTVYMRAHLNAGTTYWIHVGDKHSASKTSSYCFDLMHPLCPNNEPALHNTCETAAPIACNDSVYADSAWEGHPDWFVFNVETDSRVVIWEGAREFGHCNSGYYSTCIWNPLDAHFRLYCDCFSDAWIAEGDNEGCSTDARLSMCLTAGTYYIEVINRGVWPMSLWDYILKIECSPTTEVCDNLCGNQQLLCPDGYDPVVTLNPTDPIPGPQHFEACARLDTALVTQIIVPVTHAYETPVVFVESGCSDCADTITSPCQPLDFWDYDDFAWTFVPGVGYVNTIHASAGAVGCCVCIRLDFIWPVELLSFVPVAGDQSITLLWSTASETRNDHFDILRDNVLAERVSGAGNSSSRTDYRWEDVGLNNGQEYRYTLVSVSENGVRQDLGTVNVTPREGAALVSAYALRQNYPNPFNAVTRIAFDLVEAGQVELTIYNLLGGQVVTLINGYVESGAHEVTFDSANLPSGLYVYSLRVNGLRFDRKMLLMK